MSYDRIIETCLEVRRRAEVAGYPMNSCVWEFTQSVVDVLDHHEANYGAFHAYQGEPWVGPPERSFLGIPFRIVGPESPPITLKLVNMQPYQ